MHKVVVFDIDGTLANIEHRRSFVATKPKNWKAFTAGIPHDTPYEDIVWLAKMFCESDNTVILCSGRGEEQRTETIDQMRKFDIVFDALYMRQQGDHRQDSIVKVELLQQIRSEFGNPDYWFDDRNQVVNAIRAEGVRVLQVCAGDF